MELGISICGEQHIGESFLSVVTLGSGHVPAGIQEAIDMWSCPKKPGALAGAGSGVSLHLKHHLDAGGRPDDKLGFLPCIRVWGLVHRDKRLQEPLKDKPPHTDYEG